MLIERFLVMSLRVGSKWFSFGVLLRGSEIGIYLAWLATVWELWNVFVSSLRLWGEPIFSPLHR